MVAVWECMREFKRKCSILGTRNGSYGQVSTHLARRPCVHEVILFLR